MFKSEDYYKAMEKINEYLYSVHDDNEIKGNWRWVKELNDLIVKEDYDLAKDIIAKIESMELSDEESLTKLHENKNIVENYFIEKSKLEIDMSQR